MGAGGNHDLVGAILQTVVGRHFPHAKLGFDVLQLIQLEFPVSNNASELGATRVTGYVSPVPAEFGLCFPQMNLIDPVAENDGTFQASGSPPDAQHPTRIFCSFELLGMPAPAILLSKLRVLCTIEQALLLH